MLVESVREAVPTAVRVRGVLGSAKRSTDGRCVGELRAMVLVCRGGSACG